MAPDAGVGPDAFGGAFGLEKYQQQQRLQANIEAAKKEEARLNELEKLKKPKAKPGLNHPKFRPLQPAGAQPSPVFPQKDSSVR